MLRYFMFVILSAVTFLSWHTLGRWIAGGSERFHLLIVPVFVAFYACLAPEGIRGLRVHARSTWKVVVSILVLVTIYAFFLPLLLLPNGKGNPLRSFSFLESLIAGYFVISIVLLVIVILNLLRWLCRQSDERFSGPLSADSPGYSRTRLFLRQDLPALLLVPLVLPYLIGALYLHRFKVPNPDSPRELAGRDYEDVEFVTSDGFTIRGWFILAQRPSSRTLIVCHGMGNNRSNAFTYHEVGDALEANVLMFDFRGHGDSDGHTLSLGYREKLDVLAAVDFLRSRHAEQSRTLIGLGISMGNSALVQAAAEVSPPFDALILDSCFASAVEVADNILGPPAAPVVACLTVTGIPLASLQAGCPLEEVRPIDRIDSIRAPVLIIHARGDRLITVDHAERLHDKAREPKFLWITDTGNHGTSWRAGPEYLERARLLLDCLITKNE